MLYGISSLSLPKVLYDSSVSYDIQVAMLVVDIRDMCSHVLAVTLYLQPGFKGRTPRLISRLEFIRGLYLKLPLWMKGGEFVFGLQSRIG